ncbi:MAG: SagB/ThcOx family dehydrogenase [Rubrivivax sp.]
MDTLTKLALGLIGQNRPRPLKGPATKTLELPPARRTGGLPLMQALAVRHSERAFSPRPLEHQMLADVLWAAAGVNRPDQGGRTAPSAMHAQEIDLYAALPTGLYRYEPASHRLALAIDSDVRRVTGYQDFVDDAGLDLVYVADHRRMGRVHAAQRGSYASCTAGAMAQNVYLACASMGLATVLRAWFDRPALSHAMGLVDDEEVLFAQTVGYRAAA